MASALSIMKQIESLHPDDQKEIYRKLRTDLLGLKSASKDINKYRGVAKDVWDKDAQQYVEELRSHDRI